MFINCNTRCECAKDLFTFLVLAAGILLFVFSVF